MMMLRTAPQTPTRAKGDGRKSRETVPAVPIWRCCRCGDCGMTTLPPACAQCLHWRCREACSVEYIPQRKGETTQFYSRGDRGLHLEALQPSGEIEPQPFINNPPTKAPGHPFPAAFFASTSLIKVHPSYPSSTAGGNQSLLLAEPEESTIDPRHLGLGAVASPPPTKLYTSDTAQTLSETPHQPTNTTTTWADSSVYAGYEDCLVVDKVPSSTAFLGRRYRLLEDALPPGAKTVAEQQDLVKPILPLIPNGAEVWRRTGSPESPIPSRPPAPYQAAPAASSDGPTQQQTLRLACPYGKQFPQHHPKCVTDIFNRVRDVKQHLRRRHLQCPRCGALFSSRKKFDAHCELKPPCKKAGAVEANKGILPEQIAKMGNRVGGEASEQWFKLWEIVFPGLPRPASPSPDSTSTFESLGAYRHFLREHGADIIMASVQANGLTIATLQAALHAADDSWTAMHTGQKIVQYPKNEDSPHQTDDHGLGAHRFEDMPAELVDGSQAPDGPGFDLMNLDEILGLQGFGDAIVGATPAEGMPLYETSSLGEFDYSEFARVEADVSWLLHRTKASEST